MLDRYTVETMDALCIEMLEGVTKGTTRSALVAEVTAKLQKLKEQGEEWAKNPSIPFSMGSMDERNLDERIADNTKVLGIIDRRMASLRLWLE